MLELICLIIFSKPRSISPSSEAKIPLCRFSGPLLGAFAQTHQEMKVEETYWPYCFIVELHVLNNAEINCNKMEYVWTFYKCTWKWSYIHILGSFLNFEWLIWSAVARLVEMPPQLLKRDTGDRGIKFCQRSPWPKFGPPPIGCVAMCPLSGLWHINLVTILLRLFCLWMQNVVH